MIISQLRGGLGNQLFQYALGRVLAESNQDTLFLDLQWFNGQDKRKFQLENLCLKAQIYTGNVYQNLKSHYGEDAGIDRVKTGHFWNRQEWYYLHEPRLGPFIPEIKNVLADNIYLHGSWQSSKYFTEIKDLLRVELVPFENLSSRDQIWANELNDTLSIGIQVRRGDFFSEPHTKKWHGVCNLDYYKRGLEYQLDQLGKATAFIFTDDPLWCEQNLLPDLGLACEIKIVSNSSRSPAVELHLLSLCKNFVISNSTFGWWGAWLCNNKQKKVIVPAVWINTDKMDTTDVIPEDWIQLSVGGNNKI